MLFSLAWQYSVHVVIYQVDWGEASMIEAERRLLKHALEDPYNERFVFLSDRWWLISSLSLSCSYLSVIIEMLHSVCILNWLRGVCPVNGTKSVIYYCTIYGYFCVILLSNNISVTWSLLSCIPLYNFSCTYDYIMSTSTSFVDR